MKNHNSPDHLRVFSICLTTTGIAGAVVSLLGWPFLGRQFALGVLVAAIWSLLNLALLREMARVLAHPQRAASQKGRVLLFLLVVKFPVLYAVGYFVLVNHWFPLASLLTGLSLWIASFLGMSIRQVVTANV